MSKEDGTPEIPPGSPTKGEVYQHYKGDKYKVYDIALDAVGQDWVVVYEPLYDFPIKLFTRPLREWVEVVEWKSKKTKRFEKI